MMSIKPDIPIIIFTGYSDKMLNLKGKDMGIKDLILKPFEPKELVRIVRRVLDEKQRNPQQGTL